jgi:PAS domain S-box-containing protein
VSVGGLRSLRTKLFLFAAGILSALVFLAGIGLLGMQRATAAAYRLRRDSVPILQCVYRAGQALRQSNRIRDEALLEVSAPEAFDEVRQYEGRLQAAVIQFDMYMKALIWGSESVAFRTTAGGLTYAEWQRHELEGMLVVPQAPPAIRQLASQADLYFAGFSNNAGQVLKQHKRALRQALSGPTASQAIREQILQERAESRRYAERVDALFQQISTEVDRYLEALLREVSTTEQRVRMVVLTLFVFLLVLTLLLCYGFSNSTLLRPIRLLLQGVEAVRRGARGVQVPVPSGDEFGQLAQAFNAMSTDLQQTTVSKEYLDQIVNSMAEALFVVNEQATIQTVNTAACSLLGSTPGELIGTAITKLVVTDQQPALDDRLKEAITHGPGHPVPVELTYLAKSGGAIPVLFSASAMRAPDGAVQGIVCVAQDIAERRKAQEAIQDYAAKLERSNKELDDFTYIVSHDLKEPLRSLDAFSKFVMADYADNVGAEGRGYLERIRANAQRMQVLIEDLLQVSRLSRRPNELQSVAIAPLLEEVTQRFEYVTAQKGVQIHAQEPLPTILCDRVRLAEAFANLISNAIKYNDKPTPIITIRCRATDGWYQFSVSDNGPGIEPQYFEKIFEIFQRLGHKEEQEGTGVGLTIVKKVVELHKGRIWVESAVGQGTTFHFTIPRDEGILRGTRKLGEILVTRGLVTEVQVREALQEQGRQTDPGSTAADDQQEGAHGGGAADHDPVS